MNSAMINTVNAALTSPASLTEAEHRHLARLRDRGPWSRQRRGPLGSSWKRSYVGMHERTLNRLVIRSLASKVERPDFAEVTITDAGRTLLNVV